MCIKYDHFNKEADLVENWTLLRRKLTTRIFFYNIHQFQSYWPKIVKMAAARHFLGMFELFEPSNHFFYAILSKIISLDSVWPQKLSTKSQKNRIYQNIIRIFFPLSYNIILMDGIIIMDHLTLWHTDCRNIQSMSQINAIHIQVW